MSRLLRRAVAAPVAVFALATSALVVTAAPALADNSSTLTVVGTSDVFDSNLVQTVIKPGFEAANPGVTLNYVSKGSGAAIAYAEAGSASALIVHAASLENQFVAQGYSLEQYGRAIFWGDYVLLGPASDPAKVLVGGRHDIVTAFEKIAAAGVKGKADFVSRGGTPGTTVQEHALWALSTGVPTCTVDSVNGGGTAPSTTSGACPATPTNPAWYHTTGLTQGPNILNASACNYGHGADCYVFTDRGTYQYLRSTNQAANLTILTRNNSAPDARGGVPALVNSFHAYGVNPAAFSDPNVRAGINTTAATNFLNYLTSPAAQAAIGSYLANDQAGAPFLPDAAPQISTSKYPASVKAGAALTVTGTVANVVPGTPALSGVAVTLTFQPGVGSNPPVVAKTTTTDSTGAFTLKYTPTATGTYTVSTPPISKIEDRDLNPQFGDLLAASSTPVSREVAVAAKPAYRSIQGGVGVISGSVSLSPADAYQVGSLDVYGAQSSDPSAPLSLLTSTPIPVGTRQLPFRVTGLAPGTWQVQVHYVNSGVITEGVTTVRAVTVS